MLEKTGLTREEVVQRLREDQGQRSLRQFAKDLGCSASFISDVYQGRRHPGNRLLAMFGIRQITVKEIRYEYIDSKKKRH